MTSTQLPDPAYLKWPVTAPEDYIKARRELLEKEYALIKQVEEVAAQRRSLPPGPILPTYTFEEGPRDITFEEGPRDINDENGKTAKVTLADVFKSDELGHKTLIVYHMMMGENETVACSGCSMFVDGLNGVAKHIAQRSNLVIVAKAPLSNIRAYAKKRKWNDLRFLSSYDSDFNKDMGVEHPAWMKEMPQGPGLSVFQYEDGDGEGKVRFWYQTSPHFGKLDGKDVIRGQDLLTPVWQLFDVTPEGRGNWDPSLEYVEKWDGVKFD